MSFLQHLIGHSYPCNAATCPVVTGRPEPEEEREECECCRLTINRETGRRE